MNIEIVSVSVGPEDIMKILENSVSFFYDIDGGLTFKELRPDVYLLKGKTGETEILKDEILYALECYANTESGLTGEMYIPNHLRASMGGIDDIINHIIENNHGYLVIQLAVYKAVLIEIPEDKMYFLKKRNKNIKGMQA